MTRRGTSPATTLVLWGLWAILFWPTLAWFAKVLATADARLNLALLAGLVGVVVWREARGRARGATEVDPLSAVTLLAGASAYVVAVHALRINAIAGVCCGIATYGLAGRHLSKESFRAGMPVAMLVVLLLPMGGHMDTYLGFPLRLMTAEVVGRVLAPFAAGAVQQETIILFENAAAHVDLPCSGIRSLWSGLMFFCAASWVVRARLGFGWVMKGGVFVALILGANLVRVLVLSALALFAKDPMIAAVVHVPLGVLGFTAACAIGLWLLKQTSAPPSFRPSVVVRPTYTPRQSLYLGIPMALLATVPAPAAIPSATAVADLLFTPPADMDLEPAALTAIERQFLDGNGAHYTRKWRFTWRGQLTGSVLLVAARSWRAHHPPEQCLAGAGHPLAGLETTVIADRFPLRVVRMARPGGSGPRATYWFQSATYRTDDHTARVWDSLHGERPWLMVSLLFDQEIALDAPDVRALHLELSAAAAPLVGRSP